MGETDITQEGSTSNQTIVKFGDKLSLNREDDLALQIALQLYTYADFSNIKNPQDYAKECIYRGSEFVKAYKWCLSKNKVEKMQG